MGFPNTYSYLQGLDMSTADELDRMAFQLLNDPESYERASQALRRRFSRGANMVRGIDRAGRETGMKREKTGGVYVYSIEGADGTWSTPQDRIWVVAMYALWQSKHTTNKVF